MQVVPYTNIRTRLLARIGTVVIQNVCYGLFMKNQTISVETGCPQDAWTPIWLKAC